MPIDRELVETLLQEIDTELVPFIRANAERLEGNGKIISNYQRGCVAWRRGQMQHVRGLTEAINELCVARLILEDETVRAASYEPQMEGTDQTIDFLVYLVEGDGRIYYDVKTVQPEERDAWERYQRFVERGLLTHNTELIGMGGEIAHDLFASREKFLVYTLELEEKIRRSERDTPALFHLIFCSDGFQWQLDHLEDYADFYFLGHPRPDDTLGEMQAHYMLERKIIFDRSIAAFCYFERPKRHARPTAFKCNVRGPMLPF